VKGLIPEELRQEALAELAKCNKCGFCLTNCPTYLATGVEWEVARGRLDLIRAALAGELELSLLPESAWSCILCRNCLPHCPPGVRMDKVVVAVRAGLAQRLRVSPLRNLIMRGLLPRRGRLQAVATVGDWGQTLGIDRLAALIPDRRVRAAREYAPRLCAPRALLRRLKAEGLYAGGASVPVAVFLGCATELGLPDVVLALGRLLRRLGVDARLVEAACCGLPAHAWGDIEAARMAGRALLGAVGAGEVVITPCASCASFLREYPALFLGQPESAQAASLAARARPASIYLAENGLPELLATSVSATVGTHTFHDPCHLAHYLGASSQMRKLLRALPGGGFREMAGADSCCGSGGSYVMTHPEHSDAVLARKLDAVRATGAATLSTACPGCLLQLRRGLAGRGNNMRVAHVLELAAEALGQGRARQREQA
jgi:glycolate oxidase iron-sulfur subunit